MSTIFPSHKIEHFLSIIPEIGKPVVAIGNGESRRGCDLELLRGKCITVGCNALYRDYWPDFLCCVDPKMREEIAGSIFPPQRVAWRYRNRGMASGPSAISLAADRGHKTVYLLGFDCDWSPNDKQHLVNNMYKGTPNYVPSTSNKVSPMAWYNHAAVVIEEHPLTRFVQIGIHSLRPYEGKGSGNKFNPTTQRAFKRVTVISWEELLKEVSTC